MIEYLKYAATCQLFNRQGKPRPTSSRLSSVSISTSEFYLLRSNQSMWQLSLKKIMTMLGRVRRRQEDENSEIRVSRPAKNSRTEDFYKAVMIQSQRLHLEWNIFIFNFQFSPLINFRQEWRLWHYKGNDSGLRASPSTFQWSNPCNISKTRSG